MSRYRSYSIAFKCQLVEEYLSGESVHALSRRYDVGRALIRLWALKAETGAFDDERATAKLLGEYESRIEALERPAGKQALELEFLKRALELANARRSETSSIIIGPLSSPSPRMPTDGPGALDLLRPAGTGGRRHGPGGGLFAICDAFEFYGYRRAGAARLLRHPFHSERQGGRAPLPGTAPQRELIAVNDQGGKSAAWREGRHGSTMARQDRDHCDAGQTVDALWPNA